MKKLAASSQNISCMSKLLTLLISPIFLLLYLSATGGNGDASPMRKPTAASIDSVKGNMRYHRQGSYEPPPRINENNKFLFPLSGGSNRQLFIYTGEAGLGFLDRGGRIGAANLIRAYSRFSSQPTHYSYPCRFFRQFTIGWNPFSIDFDPGDQRSRGGKGGGCDAATIRGYKNIQSSNFRGDSVATQPSRLSKEQIWSKSQLKAQAFSTIVRYCSTVVASDQAWSAVVSNSAWDILSPNDPCEQATRQCELNSGNRPCLVSNMGELDNIKPDDKLTAVLRCENNHVLRENGELTTLNQFLSRAQNRTSACSLHVLEANDLLVFPTTDEPTVITTDLAPNGQPLIVVLAGTVTIVSADPSLAPSTLAARQICTPLNEVEACSTFNRNLDPDTRQDIYQSTPVQSFIDPEQWSLYLEPDIERYRNAVQQQFFSSQEPTPTPTPTTPTPTPTPTTPTTTPTPIL